MKIAAVQMDIALGDVAANLDRIEARLAEAAGAGAGLVIFPECAVTGYCFESAEDARRFAEPVPGPATERIGRACARLRVFAVFGMLEVSGARLFNAAVLLGPDGLVGSYRKVHLPFLGVDRFANPGDRPFAVLDAGPVRVGLNICYDASFPESARSLALLGADLVALPTNWPHGSECVAANVVAARALENGIYFAAANRIGLEAGFPFIGRSRICDPSGQTLAACDSIEEGVLYAEVDPERARRKRIVRVPGRHEIDRFADRRPEMYGALVAPHSLERRAGN